MNALHHIKLQSQFFGLVFWFVEASTSAGNMHVKFSFDVVNLKLRKIKSNFQILNNLRTLSCCSLMSAWWALSRLIWFFMLISWAFSSSFGLLFLRRSNWACLNWWCVWVFKISDAFFWSLFGFSISSERQLFDYIVIQFFAIWTSYRITVFYWRSTCCLFSPCFRHRHFSFE